MRLRTLAIVLLRLCPSSSALADAPSSAPKWEMFDEEDGVQFVIGVTLRVPISWPCGRGFIAAPITRVGSVLIDRKRAHEWIESPGQDQDAARAQRDRVDQLESLKTPTPLKIETSCSRRCYHRSRQRRSS